MPRPAIRGQLAFRVVSGAAVAAVAVAAVWFGPPWLTLLGLLGGSIAIFETYGLAPAGAGRLPLALGVVAVLALLLTAEAASGKADYLTASGIVLAVWTLVAALWFIACYSGERPVAAFLLLLLGPVYAGFMLGHGLAIYDIASSLGGAENLGRNWLLFTLAGTSASDTGAYAVGRLIGRHRMAPRVSPGKTWEGVAGGFAASVGAMLAVGALLGLGVDLWEYAVVSLVVAIVAQAGDLAESSMKRAANVKDSGSIMPGHGGLLDRIDSILFALPAVYYLLAMGFGL
jgi:phosphatidate cytidylyltransferase